MRKAMLGGMLFVLTFGLLACPRADEPVADRAGEVNQMRQGYLDAYNRHDAQAVAQFYTSDGLLVNPDGSELRGRDQIQQALQQLFAEIRPQLSATPETADGEQNVAWEYGTFQLQPGAATTGQPVQPGQQPAPGQPGQPQQQQPAPGQPGQPQQPLQAQPTHGRYLTVLERHDNDRWLIRVHMNQAADMTMAPGEAPPGLTPPAAPPADTPAAAPPADAPAATPPADTPAAQAPPAAPPPVDTLRQQTAGR
jgi:ketosteroid isomerase-like protein